MKTIATRNDIINARANGGADDSMGSKVIPLGGTLGNWYFSGGVSGDYPAMAPAAINPGSLCDANSTGAWPLKALDSGNKKYLLTAGITVTNAAFSVAMLADVLWAGSGINLNTNALQAINSSALTRHTDGRGNIIFFWPTVAAGATPSAVTLWYYNDQGVGTTQGFTIAASSPVLRQIPALPNFGIPLNGLSRKNGVRRIVQVQLASAMGAGTASIAIVHPLMMLPTVGANMYIERDATIDVDGLTELESSADVPGCLQWFFYTNSTSTSLFNAMLRTVEG